MGVGGSGLRHGVFLIYLLSKPWGKLLADGLWSYILHRGFLLLSAHVVQGLNPHCSGSSYATPQ